MSTRPEPKTAIDAYKAIIDHFVDQTTNGLTERLVRESGKYSNAVDSEKFNAFVASLTQEQRELLAMMLREERIGATHDVLAELTWWLLCRDVGLTFRGEPMPFELSGMGLHGDYMGRLGGWEWPEEDEPG
ncbi:MAG: DUF6547 family protein [Phycisphaerae bacterium]